MDDEWDRSEVILAILWKQPNSVPITANAIKTAEENGFKGYAMELLRRLYEDETRRKENHVHDTISDITTHEQRPVV